MFNTEKVITISDVFKNQSIETSVRKFLNNIAITSSSNQDRKFKLLDQPWVINEDHILKIRGGYLTKKPVITSEHLYGAIHNLLSLIDGSKVILSDLGTWQSDLVQFEHYYEGGKYQYSTLSLAEIQYYTESRDVAIMSVLNVMKGFNGSVVSVE